MTKGILLINLGTPKASTKKAVKTYLHSFLTDAKVIELPLILRYLLVYCIIVPQRAAKSAQAYQKIWSNEGSPLLVNSINLQKNLQKSLGTEWQVALGMRYGQPSISQALESLKNCSQLTILPLYPQYAISTTGSCLAYTLQLLAKFSQIPHLNIIKEFYASEEFLQAQAALIKPHITTHDYILFSYHSLPIRQIKKYGCKQLCTNNCPEMNEKNSYCYRAQCFATTDYLAKKLHLSKQQYGLSFQSRLGKIEWLKPYTDQVLMLLRSQGIEKLAISCPSFVSDCLETLEEIGIRAREQWLALGGKTFTLIPSLNANNTWVNTLNNFIVKNTT